jgi:putative transposase
MKMGCTITSESHVERSVATQFEIDPNVLEFWEQPPIIEIRKTDKRGSRRRRPYTADFLVLSKTGPVVNEIKTLEEAENLVMSEPRNWVKTEKGFDFIPAREAFQLQYGLRFEVVVVSRRDQQIAENIRIQLAAQETPLYDPYQGMKTEKLLTEQPVWRLDELASELDLPDYTAVIQMIYVGRLAFDQASASLATPERCYVASNPALLAGISRYESDALLSIQATDGMKPIATELMPSSGVAERVLRRLQRIESGEKSSSIRRWKAQIAKGHKKGLAPFQALIDADKNLVGRSSKLTPEVKAFLDYFIDNVALLMRTESSLQIYYEYCSEAKEAHPDQAPVSTQTFYVRLAKIAPELVGQAKGGRRMALAMAAPTDPNQRHLAPLLPWMKTSVDHYKVDLFLVVFEDGDNIYVAKPWLSLMIDVASSEVLAFALSFQDPSRRSCAKLIRECVRRHGKLPREILVDHGSDFTSVYFRSLLAHYRITHSLRPVANPRAGSEVERFFGEYRQQWLSQRPGFVFGLKTLRAIDGKYTPDKFAALTVEDAYQELAAFLSWRSSKPRGAASKSASVIYKDLIEKFPFIPIKIEYDAEFVCATSVESSDYKIDFQRGIHIKDLHYYCSELRELQGVKTHAEVRIDPEIPYVIYVRINGKWCPAYNANYNRYVEWSLQKRIAEGILVYECSSIRRKVGMDKGLDLALIRKDFDKSKEDNILSRDSDFDGDLHRLKISEVNEKKCDDEEIFNVRDIPTESW